MDKKNGFLSFDLIDVLQQLDGSSLHWSILELEASGDLGEGKSILDLEATIRESPHGLLISWDDLVVLASKLHQVVWGLIIGSSDPTALKNYPSEMEASRNCDIVIYMFDSSYCDVYARDTASLDRILERFQSCQSI